MVSAVSGFGWGEGGLMCVDSTRLAITDNS